MEPLVYGDYPKSMRDLVKTRLPIFTEKQKIMLEGSCDFFGLNYYTSSYAKNMFSSPAQILYHSVDALAKEVGKVHNLYSNFITNLNKSLKVSILKMF